MEKSKNMKKIKVISVIAFIILFLICAYVTYRTEYLQILEIGEEYLSVFEQRSEYKVKLFLFNFIFIFLSVFINNLLIKKGLKVFFNDEKKEMPKLPNKSIAFIISIIVSIIATSIMLERVVLYINQAWFGISDPIFGLDIGFYFFQKPFILMMLYYIVIMIGLLTIYTAAYYIIVFNVYLEGIDKELLIKSSFVKRLKTNALLIIVGIAGIVFLSTYDIVFSEFITLKDTLSTKIIGAGLDDITIKVWGYRILSIVMIISTIFILKYIGKGRIKKLLTSICIVPAYLVSMIVVLIVFNLIFVNSNRLDKEKQYIGYNIDYTKQAYNLNIEEIEIDNVESITKKDLENNTDIIDNIRLNDTETVLKNLNTLQTNSGYYSYRTAKLLNYDVQGKDTLVYISPREISTTDTSTYNNKTYEYTHGFGTVISYANTVDSTGNIKYVQKDFVSNNEMEVEEPRIYFGMETNSAIITNLNNKSEFDYPITSTKTAEYQYKGKAGIEIGFLDRLILSITNKDIDITFSDVSENSKVLLNRNIIERAKKVIPELQYDEEPYLIISDEGKQIWVLDAYTMSNQFPYSQRTKVESDGYKKDINYIRNSVKVLIDSYNGTVDFYIMDKTDPIAVAYSKIYPIFKDGESISESISSHFVYPEYLYNVQAEILKIYHNVGQDVLYRGDDIWDYAAFSSNSKTTASMKLEPYYTMVKENGGNEVGLIIPYTIDGRQNIVSYLIGTDDNGKLNLKLYKYEAGSNIIGPEQLDKEIEEDETIASEIRSVNVTGTKITKSLIIVPVNNSLLYVEPIYQHQLNEKNALPLMKKVIVASGNKVAIGDNLDEALENLVSQSAVNIKVESTDTLEDLINTIINANKNLKESTASKDFEMIGKDITRLQSLIDELEKQNEEINDKKDEEVVDINVDEKTLENVVQ